MPLTGAPNLGCACDTWSKGDARDGLRFCHLEFWYGKTAGGGKVWTRGASGCDKGCVLERVRGGDHCFDAKARLRRAADLKAGFRAWMRTQLPPAAGKRFHISNAECRELRDVSSRHQVVVVFSLARSAASTLTVGLATEMGGQYMDELFSDAVPLDRHSGGHLPRHTQAQPAALLSELLHAVQRPVVFKLNNPNQLPLGALSQLSRCANWCPVVLERANVRDRWCSWVRALNDGWWGTRKANRIEVPCPDTYKGDSLRLFTARHNKWYNDLRSVLMGSNMFVTFDQVVKNTTETRRDVRRFCSQHVQKIAKNAPI